MGGVDNADHLRVTRLLERRSEKPCVHLNYWVIGAMPIYACIIYLHAVKTFNKKGIRRNFHMDNVVPEYGWQPSGVVRYDPTMNRGCLRSNCTLPWGL